MSAICRISRFFVWLCSSAFINSGFMFLIACTWSAKRCHYVNYKYRMMTSRCADCVLRLPIFNYLSGDSISAKLICILFFGGLSSSCYQQSWRLACNSYFISGQIKMLQVQYKFRLKFFWLILKILCHRYLSPHSRTIRTRRQRNLILINPILKKKNKPGFNLVS